MIPKCLNPIAFNDFRAISPCNMIYKIITKIIVVRIRPILAKFISKEQFGFLPNMQIMDVVGVAQEFLHNQSENDKCSDHED